jgi:hypothetical protein
MMIYNSKKTGEKEKKTHGRGSKPGDATNIRVSLSLLLFKLCLFFVLSVTEFAHSFQHWSM